MAAPGATTEMLVRKAVEGLGGMQKFVKRGQTVAIKPNASFAQDPSVGATTDPEVVAAIRPVQECFADTIVEVGALGAGHTLKLINNFLSIGTCAIIAEAATTGTAKIRSRFPRARARSARAIRASRSAAAVPPSSPSAASPAAATITRFRWMNFSAR